MRARRLWRAQWRSSERRSLQVKKTDSLRCRIGRGAARPVARRGVLVGRRWLPGVRRRRRTRVRQG